MKRVQLWCDSCGRFIQDKKYDIGDDNWPLTIDNKDTAWELWSPHDSDDRIFCSLECVVTCVQGLIKTKNENSENH